MAKPVLFLWGLAAGLPVLPLAAQNCRTNHLGFFVGSVNTAVGVHAAYRVDPAGRVTTFTTGRGSPPWPLWGNTFGAAMDWDNKTLLLPGLLGTASPLRMGVFQFDPAQNAVVGTLWSGVLSTLSLSTWANWDLTADGDPVTVDHATLPQAVAVYDRFQGAWVRYPFPANVPAAAGISGVEWDKLRGGVLVAGWGPPSFLYRADLAANPPVHTTVAVHTSRVSRYGGTQVENGDWISSTCCTVQYYRVAAGTSRWQAGPPAGAGSTIAYDVTHENYACPGRGVFVANFRPSDLRYLDLTTGAVTNLLSAPLGTTPLEVVPLWGRDLWAKRVGKAQWLVSFNPGAGRCAGKAYVIAVSLVAPRPVRLTSGRQIFVGADPLCFLSLGGRLAPFFTHNVGVLPPTGQAVARLDLTGLGGGPPLTLHFVAVALDENAPDGLCWVSDPFAHRARILP